MIRAENIQKSFGDVEVLKGISFNFEQGKTKNHHLHRTIKTFRNHNPHYLVLGKRIEGEQVLVHPGVRGEHVRKRHLQPQQHQ